MAEPRKYFVATKKLRRISGVTILPAPGTMGARDGEVFIRPPRKYKKKKAKKKKKTLFYA
jgi:hypothetical protein